MKYIVVIILLYTSVCVWTQSPVFLVHPESITAIDGTTVQFTCTANNTEQIGYRVNGTTATLEEIMNKGFNELGAESMSGMVIRANLSVSVSSLYNNTEIFCRAIGTNNINSNTAILTVQGPLSSVGGLSYSFINSSTVNITWSPPFTLPGTNIIGYNISVAINGSNSDSLFTMESYEFILTSVTNSPCDQINITVAGYNGLDGDTNTLTGIYLPTVPPDDTVIPVTVSINSALNLSITIDVTELCIGQRPTVIDVLLFSLSNGTLLDMNSDIMLPENNQLNSITVNNVLKLVEDIQYIILLEYSNLAGEFDNNGSVSLNTIGIESVTITDNSNGRVCIECIFTLFSTDIGCTVELISLPINYTTTFTRSNNTANATGCISNVNTGLYTIRVYDQSSTIIVYSLTGLNVTEQPVTSTSTITATSTVTTTTTDTTTPTITPTVGQSSKDNSVIIYGGAGGGVGVAVLILIVIVIILVSCIVLKRNRQKKMDITRGTSADDIIPNSSSSQQDLSDLYAKPHKVQSPIVYAELSVIQENIAKNRKNTITQSSKPAVDNSKVIYSDVVINPPPPPPAHLMESSITVIPGGTEEPLTNDDVVIVTFPKNIGNKETTFNEQTDAEKLLMLKTTGYSFPTPINDRDSITGEEMIGRRLQPERSHYPPPPQERAPSPPSEDNQPPPIPTRKRENPPPPPPSDGGHHDRQLSEEGFTDESFHPQLAEIRPQKVNLHQDFMNTPTATYL